MFTKLQIFSCIFFHLVRFWIKCFFEKTGFGQKLVFKITFWVSFCKSSGSDLNFCLLNSNPAHHLDFSHRFLVYHHVQLQPTLTFCQLNGSISHLNKSPCRQFLKEFVFWFRNNVPFFSCVWTWHTQNVAVTKTKNYGAIRTVSVLRMCDWFLRKDSDEK